MTQMKQDLSTDTETPLSQKHMLLLQEWESLYLLFHYNLPSCFLGQALLRLQSISGVQPWRAVLHVHHHRGVAHQHGREAVHRAAGVRRTKRHRVQHPGWAQGFRKSFQVLKIQSYYFKIKAVMDFAFEVVQNVLFSETSQTFIVTVHAVVFIKKRKSFIHQEHFCAKDAQQICTNIVKY